MNYPYYSTEEDDQRAYFKSRRKLTEREIELELERIDDAEKYHCGFCEKETEPTNTIDPDTCSGCDMTYKEQQQ